MSYKIRLTLDVDWVPDGSGLALLGQSQSNNPGYTASLTPGEVGASQTLELMVAESVPGGDSPTLANFYTAISNAASDLAGTPPNGGLPLLSQPGAAFGSTSTPLALIQGWSTGGV